MIWESSFWKGPLLKDADVIERWARKKSTQKQASLLERKIMIAACSIRKLSEAHKLSDKIADAKVKVRSYAPKGTQIHSMNWDKIDKHYYLESYLTKERSWNFMCNQIIHSYVFVLMAESDDGSIDGFLVSSDRDRSRSLHGVSLVDFCNYCRVVGSNYSASGRWRFDAATGKEMIQND